MEKNIRKLAEKYFRGECTSEETEQILAWFDTREGQHFLENRLDWDLSQIAEVPDPEIYDKVPTTRIKSRLNRARKQDADRTVRTKRKKKHRGYSTVFATAASLLLLVAVFFLLYHYSSQRDTEIQLQQQEIVYTAGSEEHKNLILSDGSTVRLNRNSRLVLPEVFQEGKREVTLKGEAYFEIDSNPEKPFIVNTDHAVIRVLGTSFNVKASSQNTVQVAVKEGRVAFQEKNTSNPREVMVTQDQLGYLEIGENEIKVEKVPVDNYLSWMTRRLEFDNIPFRQVCTQLERIYDIDCLIRDEQLSQIHFTANFERQSLEKVLEVIANSLDIDYQLEGKQVIWINKEMNDNTLTK